MKLPIAITEIVSDFHGFHHLHPSVSSSSSLSSSQKMSRKVSSSSLASSSSRHSLNIPVGVNEVPTVNEVPPAAVHFIKHASSPAVVSRVASVGSLQGKVAKIRRTASLDSEHEFDNRKVSTTSYRVMH